MKYSRSWHYLCGCSVLALLLISSSVLAQEAFREFEQQLNEKTVTFQAVNPYTKVPGNVTITLSGTFRGKRLESGRKAGWSEVKGEQQGSFEFVPFDSTQPTYKGTFRFGLVGDIPFDRHNDILAFAFLINTVGTDGSKLTFIQRELATVNESYTDVAFGDLEQLDSKPDQNAGSTP